MNMHNVISENCQLYRYWLAPHSAVRRNMLYNYAFTLIT